MSRKRRAHSRGTGGGHAAAPGAAPARALSRGTLTASDVLDKHTALTEAVRGSQGLRRFVDRFMRQDLGEALGEGGPEAVARELLVKFWPARSGSGYAAALARELGDARTYQVSAGMTDAISGVYARSRQHIDHLEEDDLPWEAGFAWLDKPALLGDGEGVTMAFRAISWSAIDIHAEDDQGPVDARAVRLAAWAFQGDTDTLARRDEHIASQDLAGTGLMLVTSTVVPFGMRWPPTRSRVADDFGRWCHTLMLFLDAEITVAHKPKLERPALRRAQRSLKQNTVTVIMLRRLKQAAEGEPGHRTVDWTCRWIVQGFWRHNRNDYPGENHRVIPDAAKTRCSICGNKINWSRACLRGPSWLPLRQRKGTVYKLAR